MCLRFLCRDAGRRPVFLLRPLWGGGFGFLVSGFWFGVFALLNEHFLKYLFNLLCISCANHSW